MYKIKKLWNNPLTGEKVLVKTFDKFSLCDCLEVLNEDFHEDLHQYFCTIETLCEIEYEIYDDIDKMLIGFSCCFFGCNIKRKSYKHVLRQIGVMFGDKLQGRLIQKAYQIKR